MTAIVALTRASIYRREIINTFFSQRNPSIYLIRQGRRRFDVKETVDYNNNNNKTSRQYNFMHYDGEEPQRRRRTMMMCRERVT